MVKTIQIVDKSKIEKYEGSHKTCEFCIMAVLSNHCDRNSERICNLTDLPITKTDVCEHFMINQRRLQMHIKEKEDGNV